MTPALVLALLLGAGLLGLALRTEELRRIAPALPPTDPAAPVPPGCTVLLPVRDERANVLPCVETLLAQTARPRVRVVDDGSTDGTGGLVLERAAGEPRLERVEADPLPPGWRGKLHALHCGWRRIDTPWVLLTDADTRHGPELLARALAAARQHGLDAVSLAGSQEARGAGESLLTPAIFALLDAWLGDWRPAAAGAGPAVANGQFILLRREAWDACGGFESIRSVPLDDVALAARLREHGWRTGFFRAPELRVRMYQGLGGTWRGWRRNLAGLLGHRPALVAGFVGILVLPAAALAGFLVTGRFVEAALLWSAGAAASSIVRTEQSAWGLLYPVDALLLAAVLALSVLDRRRGRMASWKGREMPV